MLGWGAIAALAAVMAHWSRGPQHEMARCGGRFWPRYLASFRPAIHRLPAGDGAPTPAITAEALPFQRAGTYKKVGMR